MLTALHLDTYAFLQTFIRAVFQELTRILYLTIQSNHFLINFIRVICTFHNAHSLLGILDVKMAEQDFSVIRSKPGINGCDSLDFLTIFASSD